jgi:hypothetical protein
MIIDATSELARPSFIKNLDGIVEWTKLLASADIVTASEIIVEWVNNQYMQYEGEISNPVQALAKKSGNCLAGSLIVSGLASLCVNLEPGLIVVASETASSAHCMSSLTDKVSGISVVIDNYTEGFSEDTEDKRVRVCFQESSNTNFGESVFGGMKTALKLLDDRTQSTDSKATETVELDGSNDESWSLWIPKEKRFTKTIVTGFFGNFVAQIADYYSEGAVSDTSIHFINTASQFKRIIK